jgi:hypothetical protein
MIGLSPEKRKVGGSIPPLTTTHQQAETAPHLRKRGEGPLSSCPADYG